MCTTLHLASISEFAVKHNHLIVFEQSSEAGGSLDGTYLSMLIMQEESTIKMVNFDSSVLLTGPIASFAFNLQPYIFPVFHEDENKIASSHRRTSRVLARTSSLSSLSYASEIEAIVQEKQQDKERRDKHIVYSAMLISFVIYMIAGTQPIAPEVISSVSWVRTRDTLAPDYKQSSTKHHQQMVHAVMGVTNIERHGH